ncbi:MAG: hypothetical protein NUV74_04975 [Candidatus Brocadiaceae bacterium]|nr:hypothetical protein [Candidatus Brocadiaceae bacterium]
MLDKVKGKRALSFPRSQAPAWERACVPEALASSQAGSILQIEPKGLNGIRNFEQCTSREHAKCFGSIVDD